MKKQAMNGKWGSHKNSAWIDRYWNHKGRLITRKGGSVRSSSASFPAHSIAVSEAISRSVSWHPSMGRDSPLLRKQPSDSSSFTPGCLSALCRSPGVICLWNTERSRTRRDFFPCVWCIEPSLYHHKTQVPLSGMAERIDSQSRLGSQVPDSLEHMVFKINLAKLVLFICLSVSHLM